MNCKDLFLQNIVGIHILLDNGCHIPIPPSVSLHSLAYNVDMFPEPAFKILLNGGGDVEMDSLPSIKASNERSAAGLVFTHDVQISTYLSSEMAQKMCSNLQGRAFHLIYISADNDSSLGYSLPNTSVIDVELSPSPSTPSTIKIKFHSMSGFIGLDSSI